MVNLKKLNYVGTSPTRSWIGIGADTKMWRDYIGLLNTKPPLLTTCIFSNTTLYGDPITHGPFSAIKGNEPFF